MVADVTETRDVIPSLEFKTSMTIKSKFLLFWIWSLFVHYFNCKYLFFVLLPRLGFAHVYCSYL